MPAGATWWVYAEAASAANEFCSAALLTRAPCTCNRRARSEVLLWGQPCVASSLSAPPSSKPCHHSPTHVAAAVAVYNVCACVCVCGLREQDFDQIGRADGYESWMRAAYASTSVDGYMMWA